MTAFPSRPSIPNAFSRSSSSLRRAQRNRRRSTLERLEDRVVLSYVLSFNSGTNAATAVQSANTGNVGDSLVIEQVPGTGLEWSVNNSAFSNVWAGGTAPNTPPNTSAVTVTITQVALATNNTITLGNASSPISSMNPAFVIGGTPASSSLSLDDSVGTAVNTYTFNGSLFSNTGSTFTATINSGTVENNGITITGSSFGDTYDATGSHTGQAVAFVGGVGSNTVNVGSTPATPATSSLSTIASAVSFTDTQVGGTATVNVLDAGSTNSVTGTGTIASSSPNVIGFGFPTGGSLSFNTGTSGTTALNVFPGSSAGGTAGVTTNVVSTPSTLATKITGSGTLGNTFNIGGTVSENLSNVAGAVTVVGNGSGLGIINVNDQNNASFTYTVTSTTVTRAGTFGGLTYSGIGTLTLNSSVGVADTINVNSTANGITTNVNANNSAFINVNGTGTGGTLNVTTNTGGLSVVSVIADSEPVNITTNGPTASFDTVNIGATGGTGNLPGITGLVTVSAGAGTAYALTINDQGDASAQTYNVNINGAAGTNVGQALLGTTQFLSFQPGSIIPTATGTGLTFNGGSGGNVVNFNDLTPSGATTNIFAGAGSDTTNLRGSGGTSTVNIDSQAGTNIVTLGGNTVTPFPLGARWLLGTAVNVADTGGTTALTVDDSQDTTARTATLTGTSITGLSPATINFTAPTSGGGNGVNALTVNGGHGGNTFTVSGTLANSVAPETLNKGAGASASNTVNVFATSAGGPLTLTGTGTADTVTIGQNGSVAGILGPVNIDESPGSTALTIDLSNDDLPHTLDLSSDGTTSTLHDELGNLPKDITYVTTSLASLTINTDGSASQTLNLNFGDGGNPIPTASSPGLVFNAGNPAAGVSSALNIFGELPSGAFQTETHNANDQTVFPQVGQYGSIFFVDGNGIGTSLDYTGLQPINDTTPAIVYTFNDFGYPDQSFLAQVGPTVLGFDTVQFANTPTPGTPLNFETTNISNKASVTFNTLPQTAGVAGPAVSGVVNIPTAYTGTNGLTTLTFNTPNDGNNNVSFLALPAGVTTAYNGDGADEATSVTGKGVKGGTTLTLNGGPAINSLTYDAGGLVPTVTPIPNGLSITVPGAGTVDVFNYQSVNIIDVTPLVITPTANPISSVEGFNYVNIPVGSFTAPTPTIFAGLPVGAQPVPALPASAFTSLIDWGDPTPDLGAGTITQNASNPSIYYITGTHTFAQAGTDTVTNTLNLSGGSITYPVPVTLSTSPASTTTIPVTVNFNAANGAPITSSATATVTQGPLAVTVFPLVGTEGVLLLTQPLATFIDAGGANPASDYTATVGFTARLTSDDIPPVTLPASAITQIGDSAQYTVTLPPGLVFGDDGTYTVNLVITDNSGATPISVAGSSQAVIADAPLDADPVAAITANTGQPLTSTTVGVFTDVNLGAPLTDYTGTIDWGDGSPTSTASFVDASTPGSFDVQGSHTYAAPGTYTITSVVFDVGGSTVTLTGTATVTDLALTGSTQNFTATEGINTGQFVLATFTDPNTLATVSDVTAALAIGGWGDGTPTAAGVTLAVQQIGVSTTAPTAGQPIFEVLGSHTYAEETPAGLPNTLSVIVTTSGGVSTTLSSPPGGGVTVLDAALTSSNGTGITGVEGAATPATTVLGSFTDANQDATNADFLPTPGGNGGSVVVNWGDGSTLETLTAADITASGSAQGVIFTLTAGHPYTEEGTYAYTVTVNDDGGATTIISGSAVIADAALSAPTQTPIVASTGIALPASTVVGTFIDANPGGTVSDFTATIDWGDGTPLTQGTIIATGPMGTGTGFDVEGGHTYAAHGTYTITTVVTDVGGSVVTITNTATVTDVAPTGDYVNFTAQEGQSTGTIVLATVTDPDTLATVADLSAMLVNWGDGTPTSPVTIAVVPTGGTATDTTFELLGSHTYHEEGTFTFTITAATPGGEAVTFTPTAGGTATVNDAPLSASGSISITDVEGDPTPPSKLIATFTDANPFATVADFTTGGGSVVVNWGDGSPPQTLPASAITSSGLANGVLFSVTSSHTFDEEGSYQITVTATDDGGSTTVAHASAVIADAPLAAGAPVALTPNTGVLLNGVTVAMFTDANPFATVKDFTATIDWGDGTPTTVGTIAASTGGLFDVEGTHAYAKPGTYDTKVVVTDVGGSVVYIPGTATVTDPPLSGTARSFTAVEGQNTGTILLATIDNPNTLAGVSQLTATVNWGDSTTNFVVPVSLVGGTPSDSIFQINGSHTYAEEGTFTVSVLVTTTGGATTAPDSPLTATATVVDAPLVAVGSESISGLEGITTGSKLVATWTDTNPGATVADYTAGGGSVVVNWGDGTTPDTLPASAITETGSPNGVVFDATDAHTYAEAGSYQITTTIDDDGGATAVAHGFAVIADAPLSAPPQIETTSDINATTAAVDKGVITETLPFTTVVATFTDANPKAPISDYDYVTINWGDGTPATAGTIIQPAGVGTTFEVLGTHTYNDILANGGGSLDFPTTVNVHDVDGSTLAISASVTVAEIKFAITGQLNPASDSGESNTDAITNVVQPNFFGTATYTNPNGQVVPAPGAVITLYATPVLGTPGSQFSIGSTTANSAGAWSLTSTVPLAQGQYVISASAVNQAGVETDEITILPDASQGVLTIDLAGPKVTALTFDRVDGQIDLTFQDNLSGLNQAEVIDAANYQLTKLHTRAGTYKVNVISATPSGPTGPENVVLSINDGRQLRGGIYTFTVFSGNGATGIRDVAGNALDGEFYGYFPSGNNIPGGNFVAGLNAVHHTIFAPETFIGHATPVSPPGTPATGTTIPTANPQLPSGNPNFSGNPSSLKGASVHHHRVKATQAVHKTSVPKTSTTVHDVALEQLGIGGIKS